MGVFGVYGVWECGARECKGCGAGVYGAWECMGCGSYFMLRYDVIL